VLIRSYLDVLSNGSVSHILRRHISRYVKRATRKIGPKVRYLSPIWRKDTVWEWLRTMRRILIHAQAYRHGAAFLILPRSSYEDLNIKYELTYDRLCSALDRFHERYSVLNRDLVAIDRLQRRGRDIPHALHHGLQHCNLLLDDSHEELAGSVRPISALSRVDGLVHLNEVAQAIMGRLDEVQKA
jgi:hypothetical protein